MYDVIGLKKAETQEEKREAKIGYVEHMSQLPQLRKVIEDEMSQDEIPLKSNEGGKVGVGGRWERKQKNSHNIIKDEGE